MNEWKLLEDGITWVNDYHKLQAYVKWDGCTHLWFGELGVEHKAGCYHHICDIDDFLKAMQALKDAVTQKFDQDYAALSDEEKKGHYLPFHRDQS